MRPFYFFALALAFAINASAASAQSNPPQPPGPVPMQREMGMHPMAGMHEHAGMCPAMMLDARQSDGVPTEPGQAAFGAIQVCNADRAWCGFRAGRKP